MRKIIFDIETRNIFDDVGRADASLLDISVVGIYDSLTDKYDCFEVVELPKLWPILENADILIGFNSLNFDLPLLNKYYSGDLRQIRQLDILQEVKNSLGRRVGLGKIAEGTLDIPKSADGLEAVRWWKNGEIEKIKRYCTDDVRITKEIYEYALKNKKLKFKEDGKVFEFPINTDKWEEKQEKAITSTLF